MIAQSQPTPLNAAHAKNAPDAKNSFSAPTATLRATPSPTRIADLQKIGTPTPDGGIVPRSPQAPVVIGRSPRVLVTDTNTIALLHFDNRTGNTTPDVTGNFTGTLVGNAQLTNGLFGNALSVDWHSGTGSYVRLDPIGPLNQGTIEAYVDFAGDYPLINSSFTIISIGGNFGSGIQGARLIGDAGRLNFELLAADGWHVASSAIHPLRYLTGRSADVWPYETWRFHHVAGTWGPRGMEIWVDGVLHGITYPGYSIDIPLSDTYACNPQAQIASPNYPYCVTPRFGKIDYVGVYTSGLSSANTTVLIGCDPSGDVTHITNTVAGCFQGRIDDVRISNIQRTYTVDIVPPSSPTPTQTPDQISGEYAVDSHTLALYHMNSYNALGYIPDATGQHDADVRGGATLGSDGRYNGSLFVNGNNSFAFGRNLNAQYGTVEAWIRPYSAFSPFSAISIGGAPGDGHYSLSLGMPYSNNTLQFGVNDTTQIRWADSGIPVSSLASCWHHVAGTWGARGVEIWVDGVKRGTNSYTGQLYAAGFELFVMGCNGRSECMIGNIDEVRFGNVQRTFTPPQMLAPVRPRAPATGDSFLFLPLIRTIQVVPPCPYG